MATSPDSSSTVVRRQRLSVTQSPAAVGARRSPRPVLPQPCPPVSRATHDEPSSSATRPPPALPKVKIPSFPEQTRPQGPPKLNADADAPSPRHRMTKRVPHAYTAKEKLHWLKLQDSQPDLSNRALAKLAKVQPVQIREWKRMRERLEVASGCHRRLMGAGRKAKYPFIKRAVYRQFLKHRAKGLAVSVNMLQQWSAQFMKHRMPGVNWRASFRWSTRFRARWHLARRVKTKMGQKLAAGVVVRAQEKGWMDKGLVQDWITQVLVPFLKPIREGTGRRRESLVVLDSYRGHLTESVGQTMRMFRLTRAVIPGGCTPLLQPLDVSVNRAFKAGVRHRYGTWFEDIGINTRTRAVLEDVNEVEEDEVIVNPYYEEARVPAEVLQADDDAMHVEEDAEDAEVEDGDAEGYGAGEGGDAEEWSEAGSDWWLPDRFDGEEVEEWHGGDDED
ncbi:unnamed protein product [Closterium sp. Yama58-4]|nr:unnamed protein product [Closterium sp. Yama58-4]